MHGGSVNRRAKIGTNFFSKTYLKQLHWTVFEMFFRVERCTKKNREHISKLKGGIWQVGIDIFCWVFAKTVRKCARRQKKIAYTYAQQASHMLQIIISHANRLTDSSHKTQLKGIYFQIAIDGP